MASGDRSFLSLQSPLAGKPLLSYNWPPKDETVCEDILETISIAFQEFRDLEEAHSVVPTSHDPSAVYEQAVRYNKLVAERCARLAKSSSSETFSTQDLSKVLKHAYNKAIDTPEQLNKYTPFSEEVYGEFYFGIIDDILKRVPFKETDSFVDLGSGVGQVVLQIAAQTQCKAVYGIEKRAMCCAYADKMASDFKQRMHWFGKAYRPFSLLSGDFTEDTSQMKRIFDECNVLLVNNFVFPSHLNLFLAEKIKDLKEGAIIISSVSFCPSNFKLSWRTANHVAAILEVEKYVYHGEGVSWTADPVDYYVQRVSYGHLYAFYNSRIKPRPALSAPDLKQQSLKRKKLSSALSTSHEKIKIKIRPPKTPAFTPVLEKYTAQTKKDYETFAKQQMNALNDFVAHIDLSSELDQQSILQSRLKNKIAALEKTNKASRDTLITAGTLWFNTHFPNESDIEFLSENHHDILLIETLRHLLPQNTSYNSHKV